MANLSKIKLNNVEYEFKDAYARANLKTYTAGEGIDITNDEISLDTTFFIDANGNATFSGIVAYANAEEVRY